jgi:hypothetical protein
VSVSAVCMGLNFKLHGDYSYTEIVAVLVFSTIDMHHAVFYMRTHTLVTNEGISMYAALDLQLNGCVEGG